MISPSLCYRCEEPEGREQCTATAGLHTGRSHPLLQLQLPAQAKQGGRASRAQLRAHTDLLPRQGTADAATDLGGNPALQLAQRAPQGGHAGCPIMSGEDGWGWEGVYLIMYILIILH